MCNCTSENLEIAGLVLAHHRGMTEDANPRSRNAISPELMIDPPPIERAQGIPGVRFTRSLACESDKAHEQVTTGSPNWSGIPCAMVLTAYLRAPPVNGLFCHRRLQVTTCKLDSSVAASGPHDFAVRFSATRQRHLRVHRIPAPRFVTIAIRPSREGGMART
jgi:hypothetical protein